MSRTDRRRARLVSRASLLFRSKTEWANLAFFLLCSGHPCAITLFAIVLGSSECRLRVSLRFAPKFPHFWPCVDLLHQPILHCFFNLPDLSPFPAHSPSFALTSMLSPIFSIPYTAEAILKAGRSAPVDLVGLAIGNGFIDPRSQYGSELDMLVKAGVWSTSSAVGPRSGC